MCALYRAAQCALFSTVYSGAQMHHSDCNIFFEQVIARFFFNTKTGSFHNVTNHSKIFMLSSYTKTLSSNLPSVN